MTNCLPKKDQLALLLSHCPPHTRLIATMLADTGMRHREELGAMTRSWVHFDEAPFPRIVVPGEASKNRVPRTIRMTKRVEALLREIMENGLVFDVRTDTNDNGGGKGTLYFSRASQPSARAWRWVRSDGGPRGV